MHKNIGIIILTLILAVVSYCYISAHYRISDLQKQLNEHNSGAKSRITLYEEDRIFYHLLSDDNKLWVLFTYDNQGLKETFGLVDDLSEKKIGFNFTKEGKLASYSYQDGQFSTWNNVAAVHPEKLIEREEWINGLGIFYTLSSDGTTELNIKSVDCSSLNQDEVKKIMSDEVFFNMVYYGLLFSLIIIGVTATIVAQSRIKLDFPEDTLRLMQKKCRKWTIIFFITMLLFPAITIIPLYIFSPKYILLIQFFILFFTIIFALLFTGYLQSYWLIRKKLRLVSGQKNGAEEG